MWLVIAGLFTCITANATDFENGGIYYHVTSSTTVEVTYKDANFNCYSGDVTIPSTVDNGGTTYTVTAIGKYACQNSTGLTSITIPNSVTSIGVFVFSGCSGMTTMTIGSGLASIGDYALNGCTAMSAFNVATDNPNFSSTDGVLFNKDKTTLIAYPNAKGATYTIPDGTITIGNGAFNNCSGLTKVTMPSSLTTIGDVAFLNCYNLTSLTIGSGVASIGDRAFKNCSSLVAFSVATGSENFSTLDGVLFNKDKTTLVAFPIAKGTTYTIPDGVTAIGSGAFANSALTEITIPTSVTSIGNMAFQSSGQLTAITIPEGVPSIGANTFDSCYALTTVTIPNSVTSIGDKAFIDCMGLTNLTLGNGLQTIGMSAFNTCKKLASVILPNSVTSIGDMAFRFGDVLTKVSIPASTSSIGSMAFQYCSSLQEIYDYRTAPQGIASDVFEGVNKPSCTVFVPVGSLTAYKAASVWSDFTNIQESDYITGIGAVSDDAVKVIAGSSEITIVGAAPGMVATVYGIAGQTVYSGTARSISLPVGGLYIVKAGNKTYKVMVK